MSPRLSADLDMDLDMAPSTVRSDGNSMMIAARSPGRRDWPEPRLHSVVGIQHPEEVPLSILVFDILMRKPRIGKPVHISYPIQRAFSVS